MDPKPKTGAVSVVMATFNGARFIEEQLDSLLRQSVLPYELIVSDDGSTDSTLTAVERFRQSAPFPVKLTRNSERLGYGLNFLSAASRASGEYIAFCDQDDVWLPKKLERAMTVLQREQAQLYVHSGQLIDDAGSGIGQLKQGIVQQRAYPALRLAPWGVFLGCTMVFSRKMLTLFDTVRRGAHTFEWSTPLSHDLWVYFLCQSLGRSVLDTSSLIQYRQHANNQTPHRPRTWLRSWNESLGRSADATLRRDSIAQQRAELMSELSRDQNHPELKSAATSAARYWGRIAGHEASRLRFYAERSLLQRGSGCLHTALSGGYLPFKQQGLGWRLLVKDTLVGVLRARRLPPVLSNAHR